MKKLLVDNESSISATLAKESCTKIVPMRWSGWFLGNVGVRTEVEVEWKSVYRKVRFASFGWLLRARPKCTMTLRRGGISYTLRSFPKLILCTQKAKPKKVDPRQFLLQFFQLRG